MDRVERGKGSSKKKGQKEEGGRLAPLQDRGMWNF